MPEPLAVARPALAEPAPRPGSEIAGLGIALPATVVENAPIARRLGIDEDWIVQRTGIRRRRVAAPGDRLPDLAAAAAAQALTDADLDGADVDLVVVATSSNERLMPAAAGSVAAAIGATAAGAYDVCAACSGFVAALSIACGQIEAGRAGRAVVVGADLMSRLADPDDRSTAPIFADGAGAVVVQGSSDGRIGPFILGSDGANAELIYVDGDDRLIKMQGHETFRHAVSRLSEATSQALELADLEIADVDLFVYHQANARILRAVEERLGLPSERIVEAIEELGNTSAATIPLALDQARRSGQLQPGSQVLLAAFGAGLNWGATTLTWGSA